MTVTAHYWGRNITAIEQWCMRWAKARVEDFDHYDQEYRPCSEDAKTVEWMIDWCRSWAEADPGDNGGDFSARWGFRDVWPDIHTNYVRLRDKYE